MQKYFHFVLAFLVISILIAGESEAENETNDGESNETSSNDNETNDDESNETSSNDNETSDNNETKEQSGFCPTEITDENKDTVDDACIVPVDETEDPESNNEDEGLLPSISLFTAICVTVIIAFRRR